MGRLIEVNAAAGQRRQAVIHGIAVVESLRLEVEKAVALVTRQQGQTVMSGSRPLFLSGA
jgi:hypothetical protein